MLLYMYNRIIMIIILLYINIYFLQMHLWKLRVYFDLIKSAEKIFHAHFLLYTKTIYLCENQIFIVLFFASSLIGILGFVTIFDFTISSTSLSRKRTFMLDEKVKNSKMLQNLSYFLGRYKDFFYATLEWIFINEP